MARYHPNTNPSLRLLKSSCQMIGHLRRSISWLASNRSIQIETGGRGRLTTTWPNVATAGRFQMTTDGLTVYKHNVPFKIGSRVDFGQLVKTYASSQTETRYSPAKIIRAEKVARFGQPDPDRICTSHVERLNLTLRMNMRRFTRLTNGFSKTLDHHRAMQGIFFCWYNMVRVHETIKTTPAIQAGIATNRWTIKEMIQKVAN